MSEESKEEESEISSSYIKRAKKFDSRQNMLLIPGINNINANKDINFENNIKSNNNISNNNKEDDSDTFTMTESSVSSSSITDNKSTNNNNVQNKSVDNPKNILKTYLRKLTSKFEDKKVSFSIEDKIKNKSQKNNYRKNSILSMDILRKNSIQSNNNIKINTKTTFPNYNKNRISNLKNYQPKNQNYENNQDDQEEKINRNSYTKKKTNNSIESMNEKISLIAEEMLNRVKNKKIEEEKYKFMRSNIKYKTILSTITSPLIYTKKINDEEFMDIINDDFSLSDKRNSFTKDNIDLNLLSKRKLQYNNIESINSNDISYSSSSNYTIPEKKRKEIIIEESPNMKKYQISSSFSERQMKRLQIRNNNINRLRKKLEKKSNIMLFPKINSFSRKIIEKKGIYIPLHKRPVNIQYDKNLKFNLFLKMKRENEQKSENNKSNKGFLSYRINESNSNIKIVKFFESQISWKEKVNLKTKKLRINLEKEKENSLNEELIFKPKILNNSEYKRKNKSKSIFMKLYHDQSVKEKKLEKLKIKLKPSFKPNINNEKSLNYYNKKNINIFNNYSNFNANNSNNTSRIINNISSNFEKLNKILYYEEEDSSATLPNRLKNCEKYEISNIKKDNIKNVEKDDTITSLTRLDSDYPNNKYPNINESNSIFIGHEFYYPDSDRSIIYNQYNNIKPNYINYINSQNKSEILNNKIRYVKDSSFQSKIKQSNEIPKKLYLSYLKENDIIKNNKSIEIKSRKVKNYNNLKYKDLQLKKLRDNYNSKIKNKTKSKLLNKEKINKKIGKEDHSIYLDLWKFNEKQNEIFEQRNEFDWKKNNNDYSRIMREKKEKIKQLKIYRTKVK